MNVHALLKKHNIRPKRSLGQNFLVAVPTIEKIVRELNSTANDKVLEIGPGIGVMTAMLTQKAKLVAAIEADKEMVSILEAEWGHIPNLHIIQGDALDTNFEKLLGEKGKWLFVGNIPYNITSPLLFHILKYKSLFKYGIITMQKEVAERLIARPGNKEYGILSVALQSVSQVEKLFNISPTSFVPEPEVESSVVRISFEDAPNYNISNPDFFTKVVRAAFGTRRKKIKNSLKNSRFLSVSSEKIEAAIEKSGIGENSRAEELDIETFVRLAQALKD